MLWREPRGVWEPLDRNPLHPGIPFPSLWRVDYFSQLLRGRAPGQVTASRHPPQAFSRCGLPKPHHQQGACLSVPQVC